MAAVVTAVAPLVSGYLSTRDARAAYRYPQQAHDVAWLPRHSHAVSDRYTIHIHNHLMHGATSCGEV